MTLARHWNKGRTKNEEIQEQGQTYQDPERGGLEVELGIQCGDSFWLGLFRFKELVLVGHLKYLK